MDSMEQAKEERGFLEKAVAWIPGYKGYKEKEMRRAADKQVRDSLVRKLDARRRKLSSLQQELLSTGGFMWVDDMEKLVASLQLLRDRVKTASYGYSPFFDLNKVKEDDLDQLIQFDEALGAELGRLDEAVAALGTAIQTNTDVKEAIQATSDVLAALNETFGRREEVIQKAA